MSQLVIRDALPIDGPSIAQEYWRHQTTTNHIEIVTQALGTLLSKVAEIDGNMVGFVYCRKFAPDILEIDNLFVNEEFRNRRIGSTLLQAIEDEAVKQFSGLILINSDLYGNPVVDKNDPATFYLRHGFDLVFTTAESRVFAKQL